MKTLLITLLCLLLCSCASHWYGIGVAETYEKNTDYNSTIQHKSFGVGVFIPKSNTWYFCMGYTEIIIETIDINKVAKILKQETKLIRR